MVAAVPGEAEPRGQPPGSLVSQPGPSLPDSGGVPRGQGAPVTLPRPAQGRSGKDPPCPVLRWRQRRKEESSPRPPRPRDAPRRAQRAESATQPPGAAALPSLITGFKPGPGRAQPGGPMGEAESPVPADGQAPFLFSSSALKASRPCIDFAIMACYLPLHSRVDRTRENEQLGVSGMARSRPPFHASRTGASLSIPGRCSALLRLFPPALHPDQRTMVSAHASPALKGAGWQGLGGSVVQGAAERRRAADIPELPWKCFGKRSLVS